MSFPQYSKYKDSGVPWLGKIPTHWELKRLRFTSQINPVKAEIKVLDKDTLVSFLPMEAIGDDGSLDLHRERAIRELETGYTFFRNGDVVLAKITPCFENGKGALMQGLKNGIGFGTTELIVVRPKILQATARFMHLIFSSAPFRKLGEAEMYGAGGQKRVPDNFVRNFSMGLPPLEEQSEIVALIDHETDKIDALVEEQQKLIELLKEKRQAVISYVVTKGLNPNARMKDSGVEWLGEMPEHWESIALSKATTKITNGYVGPTRDILMDEGVPYIQATHIKGGRVNFGFDYFVSQEWSNSHSKSILADGDVLIVQTGAGTGDVGLVSKQEIGFNCHALIILSPNQSIVNGSYLSLILQSSYGRAKLTSIQTGAMHPHLNCGEVKFVEIPLPPLKEQTAMVAFLERESARFDTLIGDATRAIELLKERRTALISAAVTGKIDVRLAVAEVVA